MRRTTRWTVGAATAALGWALCAAPAFAGTVDKDVNLGDKVTGKILVAQGDSVGARFYAVKGTVVSLIVTRPTGSTLSPAVTLRDPAGNVVDMGKAYVQKTKSAQVRKFKIPASGTYTFDISGAAGGGRFLAATAAKFPKTIKLTGVVPGTTAVPFDLQPGSTIKGAVSAPKGSSLQPTIVSLGDSAGAMTLTGYVAKGAKASFKSATSPDGGTCLLTVGAANATTGAFNATLTVIVPKSKGLVDATSDTDQNVVAAVGVAAEPAAADWDAFPALAATVSSGLGKGSTGHSYAGEFNMTGSKAGLADQVVDVRAAHDATYLYMRYQWTDATKTNDLNRRRWYFNGGAAAALPDWASQFGAAITSHPLAAVEAVPAGWSDNLNDDKLGVAWAIGDPSSVTTNGTGNEAGLPPGTTFKEAGCAVGCHASNGMGPSGGLMDLWHWKTSRSNPLGYVNDQWAGNGTGRSNDTAQGIENRNRVSNNASGPTRVLNPAAAGVTVDKFAGTATIAFNSVLNGAVNLDARTNLTFDASMPIESTDAVGGQAVYAANCESCHGTDGKKVASAAFYKAGLTWTRAEIVAHANDPAHGGANRGLDGGLGGQGQTVSVADTDKLVARIRGFSGVPGYWLREGDGVTFHVDDIAQVRNFKNVYDPVTGKYTVIIRRKLVTADTTQDVQFDDLAKTYLFGVAIMEFDGQNHAGAPLLKMVFGR